jgi:hypothetical protein
VKSFAMSTATGQRRRQSGARATGGFLPWVLLFRFLVIRPIIALNSLGLESKYEENEGGIMGRGIKHGHWNVCFAPRDIPCALFPVPYNL